MLKTIFDGWLKFDSSKSYDKVLKTYLHRKDIYYKTDGLFEEEIFVESNHSIRIPRTVKHCTEKNWRITIDMLKFVGQFAISGKIDAWVVEKGRVLKHHAIEPDNDRKTVRDFIKVKEFIEQGQNPVEAKEVLTRVIEKYEEHAMAYERRGYVNMLLKNYHDAKRDFNKALGIIPNHAQAYFGRARVHMQEGSKQEAIDDLQAVCKHSIAIQPHYWQARRIKAELHLELDQIDEALQEMKFFLAKNFDKSDPNYPKVNQVRLTYAKLLYQHEKLNESLEQFEILAEAEKGDDVDLLCETLCYRGKLLQTLGKKNFKKLFQKASELNSDFAEKLLLQLV